MKPAPLLLAASLACNVALIAFALQSRSISPTTPQSQPPGASDSKTPTPSQTPATTADDARAVIERLRAEGLPPEFIRAVARARINKQFAGRRKATEPQRAPYWRSTPERQTPVQYAARLALFGEINDAIKELVGDLPADPSPYNFRNYGNLSEDKIARLQAIRSDYTMMRVQLQQDMKGVTFPDDKSQIELLNKEERADIEKLLTPDQLRALDLRSSPSARKVQDNLKFFLASEAEYIALYDLQDAIDRQTAGKNLSADEYRALRHAAVQSVLTPERFEDFKITTSGSYETVRDLVAQLNLPAATTAQVISLQNNVTEQAAQIRNDTSLSPVQRSAQLAALAQDATARLTTSLGEAGFKNYTRTPASGWLQKLAPAPTR